MGSRTHIRINFDEKIGKKLTPSAEYILCKILRIQSQKEFIFDAKFYKKFLKPWDEVSAMRQLKIDFDILLDMKFPYAPTKNESSVARLFSMYRIDSDKGFGCLTVASLPSEIIYDFPA